MFLYGTNCGSLVLGDCRVSECCQPLTMRLDSCREKANFFTQMISSYSSLAFLNNNKQIVTRDFLSVKVWDICKTDKPIASITIQDTLKTKLCEIFENDCIFDKFNVSLSKDSNTVLTGNYNNNFHAIDLSDNTNTQYEINFKKQTICREMLAGKNPPLTKMDYTRKVIASDFNPKANMLAVASLNCFLIYCMWFILLLLWIWSVHIFERYPFVITIKGTSIISFSFTIVLLKNLMRCCYEKLWLYD